MVCDDLFKLFEPVPIPWKTNTWGRFRYGDERRTSQGLRKINIFETTGLEICVERIRKENSSVRRERIEINLKSRSRIEQVIELSGTPAVFACFQIAQ